MSPTHLTPYCGEESKFFPAQQDVIYLQNQYLYVLDRNSLDRRFKFKYDGKIEDFQWVSLVQWSLLVHLRRDGKDEIFTLNVQTLDHLPQCSIESYPKKQYFPIEATEGLRVAFHGKHYLGVINKDKLMVFEMKNKREKCHEFTCKYPETIISRIDHDDLILANAFKKGNVIQTSLSQSSFPSDIDCHKSLVTNMAVHEEILATASESGKIIRLWDLSEQTNKPFMELRRAHIWSSNEKILSLVFSRDGKFLAVLSSTKSLHIYKIVEKERQTDDLKSPSNQESGMIMSNIYGDENKWSLVRKSLSNYISDEALKAPIECFFNPDQSSLVNIILQEQHGTTMLELDFQLISQPLKCKRVSRINFAPLTQFSEPSICIELIQKNTGEKELVIVPSNYIFAQLRMMIQNSMRVDEKYTQQLTCSDGKVIKMDWMIAILAQEYQRKSDGFFQVYWENKKK